MQQIDLFGASDFDVSIPRQEGNHRDGCRHETDRCEEYHDWVEENGRGGFGLNERWHSVAHLGIISCTEEEQIYFE